VVKYDRSAISGKCAVVKAVLVWSFCVMLELMLETRMVR
jgi:hypothetical protein